jgi:hypothetical protein
LPMPLEAFQPPSQDASKFLDLGPRERAYRVRPMPA